MYYIFYYNLNSLDIDGTFSFQYIITFREIHMHYNYLHRYTTHFIYQVFLFQNFRININLFSYYCHSRLTCR